MRSFQFSKRVFFGVVMMAVSAAAARAQAPANDNFASRIAMAAALPSSTTGTNVDATEETSEPEIESGTATVWWTWMPAASGQVQINTFGSDFDTVLAVFTGSAVDALTEVTSNDDAGSGTRSQVSFVATVGTTYQIQVSGYEGATGSVSLEISAIDPLANDDFADRIALAAALPVNTTGTNLAATEETDEPEIETGTATVWWTWTPAVGEPVQMNTFGSDFDTVLAVFTGTAVDALTPVASNDQAAGGGNQSEVSFVATAGTTYQIQVSGWGGAVGSISLSIDSATAPLANDNFIDRILLAGMLPITATGSNAGATEEGGEQLAIGSGMAAVNYESTVWWSWEAPGNGWFEVNTFGSAFDTVVAVFTGTTVGALSEVASNNDADGGSQSRVRFEATTGVVYAIQVSGIPGTTGAVALELKSTTAPTPPPNDDFGNRIELTGMLPLMVTGSNLDATEEFGETLPFGGEASVWWSWQAPIAGAFEIDTIGSEFDTVLGVYTGTDVGALIEVASNDDVFGSFQSRVQFQATAGSFYRFQVSGVSGQSGAVALGLKPAPLPNRPPNDDFADSILLTGMLPVTDAGSNIDATEEPGEPLSTGSGMASVSYESTVWWSWEAPSAGWFEVDTYGSDFDTLFVVYTGAAVGTLTEVASSNDTYAGFQGPVRFEATAGSVYHVQVSGQPGDDGAISLSIATATPPPTNDSFANREPLVGMQPFTATGTNVGASVEPGEPSPAGGGMMGGGDSTTWWTWDAPISGWFEVNTIGSDFPTALGVYTGTAVGALTEVPSDLIGAGGGDTRLRFQATAGTSYQIQVSGMYGETGTIALELKTTPAPSPPPNDDFANRIALTDMLPLMASGSTVDATVEVDELLPYEAGPSAWWTWQAPATGLFEINTFGSDFGTVLAIYTGSDLASLSEIIRNESDGGSDQSRVGFQATAGTQYQIQVLSRGQTGSVSLEIAATTNATPVLNSISFDPPSVDISAGPASTTVSLDVSTPNGVDRVQVEVRDTMGNHVGSLESGGFGLTRISGDDTGGVYQGVIQVPEFLVGGPFDVTAFVAETDGDFTPYENGFRPFPAPFDGTLPVTNTNADTEAPQIVAISFSPNTVDRDTLPGVVTATVTVTDDLSGFESGFIRFRTAFEGNQMAFGNFGEFDRISGDATNGVYRVDVPVDSLPNVPVLYVEVDLVDFAQQRDSYGDAYRNIEPFPAGTKALLVSGGSPLTSYGAWLELHPEIPAGMRGFFDDPENDTFPNGMECFLGLLPMADSRSTATDPNADNRPRLETAFFGTSGFVELRVLPSLRNFNLGIGSTITAKFQGSSDGVNWVDNPLGNPDSNPQTLQQSFPDEDNYLLRFAVEPGAAP